jgi:adenylate cyclase
VPLEQARICLGCWQKLHLPVPLRGIAALPFRIVGLRPSRMNPNLCTMCESMFARLMRARHITIDATVLFADIRGYTRLSQSTSSHDVNDLLDKFYDECAEAIWENDGILNKTLGDAVMAVFNFPIQRVDHALRAVRAALGIQDRCKLLRASLADAVPDGFGVGIGVASGSVSFGEFGRKSPDLTAIGTVVNLAARAQSEAAAGEVLFNDAVQQTLPPEMSNREPREFRLKGFDEPLRLWAA